MDETIFQSALDGVAAGDLESVGKLLDAHPQLIERDELLQESAGYRRPDMTRLLLDRGAVVRKPGDHYLLYAVVHGAREVADLLASHGATSDHFGVCAGMGWVDRCRKFFHDDGSLDARALEGRIDLEDYGMPPRPVSVDPDDVLADALISAAASGRRSTVDFLLDRGVPIDREPGIGTALHWAAYWGHLDMVEYLISRGADPRLRDSEWSGTARGWAEQNGHDEIIAWLDANC